MNLERERAIATQNMFLVILLKRAEGFVRITEEEIKAYNSGDQFVTFKVVEGRTAIDVMLVTPEELKNL